MSVIEVGHFGCFDTSVSMWDGVGEYGSEENLSYGATWGIGEFLVWTKYYKKFKLVHTYF